MAIVLIIGSGAREHALAQTFAQSDQVKQIYVAPGNPGMKDAKIKLVDIATSDQTALATFAKHHVIDLTVVGAEGPLVDGIVDTFQAQGLTIFGPNKAAAQLEGSKTFMKRLVLDHQIPTARALTVDTVTKAQAAVKALGWPIVIKQDGLAAGKGVRILEDAVSSERVIQAIYQADPTARLVIEEYLEGREFSIFSLVGKRQVIHTPVAQDHKRRFEGGQGPNTGGMGAYSPVPFASPELVEEAINQLVTPLLDAMAAAGCPYQGILYTGVMLTTEGPRVIEYNVRFGDPEAQVVLPQLRSDLYILIQDLLAGRPVTPRWQTEQTYIGVVLVNPDYPTATTRVYMVPDFSAKLRVNYGGVMTNAGQLVSQRGRVVTVITAATKLVEAQAKIYRLLAEQPTDLAYRRDIGQQGLAE